MLSAARLPFSLLATLPVLALLLKAVRADRPGQSPRAAAALMAVRALLRAICLFWAVAWGITAALRAVYPFELIWTGGAFRDHCMRLIEHRPLYAAPTLNWIPLPLPPLYASLGALAMSALGSTGFVPLRVLSIVCAAGCCIILRAWVVSLLPGPPPDPPRTGEPQPLRAGRSPWKAQRWGTAAALLYLAGYGVSGAWYDLEQPGSLFALLVLAGAYAIDRATASHRLIADARESGRLVPAALFRAGIAGAAFSLALFTGLQAVVFAAAAVLVCILRRSWAVLGFFLMVTAVCVGDGWWWVGQISQGWFAYYAVTVALAQSGDAATHLVLAIRLALLCAPSLALIAAAATLGRRTLAVRPPLDLLDADERPMWQVSYLAIGTFAAAALFGGAVCDAKWGAGAHLLWIGAALTVCGAVAAAGRWERLQPAAQLPLALLVCIQALVWTYNPASLIPGRSNAAAGRRYAGVVHAAERQGEVLCLDHGGFTQEPHTHRTALEAVVNTEGRVPKGVVAELHRHPYAAILVDYPLDPRSAIDAALQQAYGRGESPDMPGTWCIQGRLTPPEHARTWILRPRQPVQ